MESNDLTGMETSRMTSPLLKFRADKVVQPRLEEIERAYLARDFQTFGKITMQDSNQFHAVCLDTYPPIFYMNDTSKAIMRLVHVINAFYGEVRAAYTFDAGPNAVIYTLAKDVPLVAAVMARYFPAPGALSRYCNKDKDLASYISESGLVPAELIRKLDATGRVPVSGDVKYMFLTRSGPGPISLPLSEALLSPKTGMPVEPSAKHKRLVIASASDEALRRKLDSRFYGVLANDLLKLTLMAGVTLGVVAVVRVIRSKKW